MSEQKNTPKAVLNGKKSLYKPLLLPYSLLAIAAGGLVVVALILGGTYGIPALLLHSEGLPWEMVLTGLLAPLQMGLFAGLFVLLLLSVAASVWAHRSMKRFVGQYDPLELTRRTRNKKIAIATAQVVGAILVAYLPTVTLCLSYLSHCRSMYMQEDATIPVWAYIAICLFPVLGTFALEVVLTYVRLLFRVVKNDNDDDNDTLAIR